MEEIKEGYTRVSSILGQWNHFAHINPEVLANKCRIGTNVHEKICAETEGIYINLQDDEKGYFESWEVWKEEIKEDMDFLDTETRFYCDELKITGCVDALVSITAKGDKLYLIDYKTSASPNKKMWALQASFYHYLANVNGYNMSTNALFVHLKKDGKKAKVYHFECDESLFNVALGALHSYRYLNG